MFEKATKNKYRFKTTKGFLSTESLWDIPLLSDDGFCLDNIAKAINKEIKESEGESFVIQKDHQNDKLREKLEIVKRIIKVKLQEQEEERLKADNYLKKQKLLEVLAEKQDESLKEKSVEELQKMIEEL